MSNLKGSYERLLAYIGNRESFTPVDLPWLTMFRDYCIDNSPVDLEDLKITQEIIANLNSIITPLGEVTAMSTTPPSFPSLPADLQGVLDFMNTPLPEPDPDGEARYFNEQKSLFLDRGFYLYWDDNEEKPDGPAYRAMSLKELQVTDAARYNREHGGQA